MQQFFLFDQCVMLPYNNDVRERCLSFTCGDADLDDFFHNDAEHYAEELMGQDLLLDYRTEASSYSGTLYPC